MTSVPSVPRVALVSPEDVAILIQREKDIIAEGQRMLEIAKKAGSYMTSTWRTMITQAERRLEAVEQGLVPVRIAGPHVPLKTLLNETQPIPSAIVEQAEEAKKRFPGSEPQVFGWDKDLVTEERRRRDPVLAIQWGGAWFFLGFWLEIAMPDAVLLPRFFGMVWPWAEKRGRGRPRKGEVINHPLLNAGS